MTGFTPAVRDLILDRQHNACARCCRWLVPGYTQVHHRRARQIGGSRRAETNLPANGLALCDRDHDWIESNRRESYRLGYLVHSYQRPCEVPVWYLGRWVRLHDDGTAVSDPVDAA